MPNSNGFLPFYDAAAVYTDTHPGFIWPDDMRAYRVISGQTPAAGTAPSDSTQFYTASPAWTVSLFATGFSPTSDDSQRLFLNSSDGANTLNFNDGDYAINSFVAFSKRSDATGTLTVNWTNNSYRLASGGTSTALVVFPGETYIVVKETTGNWIILSSPSTAAQRVFNGALPSGAAPADPAINVDTTFGALYGVDGGNWFPIAPFISTFTGSTTVTMASNGQQHRYTGTGGHTFNINSNNGNKASLMRYAFVENAGTGALTLAAHSSLTGGATGASSLDPGEAAIILYANDGLSAVAHKFGGAATSDHRHLTLTELQASGLADDSDPTLAEATAAITAAAVTSTIVYYTATDTATDPTLRVYAVDASGNVQEIENRSASPSSSQVVETFDTLNDATQFTGTLSSSHIQTVGVTQSGTVDSITLRVGTTGASSNIRVRFSNNNGASNQFDQTFNGITNNQDLLVTFPAPIAVTGGTNVRIQLNTDGGANGRWYGTGNNLPAPSTSSFSAPNDYRFSMIVVDTTLPNNFVKGLGSEIDLDVSGFANNLDNTVTNVQLLADAVDNLAASGGNTTIVTVTGDATVAATTFVHVVNAATATNQTLPAANAVDEGTVINVKRLGAGDVTVIRNGTDTIDGVTSNFDFDANNAFAGSSISFASNGSTNWTVV